MRLARDCKGNPHIAVLAALIVVRLAVLAPPAGILLVMAGLGWRYLR